MNIEEILNKIYTSDLLSSEELHELTEWVCNKDKEIERITKENTNLKEQIKLMEELCIKYEETINILKGEDKE